MLALYIVCHVALPGAPSSGADDLTSLLPRRHAPSPAQYTRPLSTVAAPTPLQTVSHIGPDLERTPLLSISSELTASTGRSSEASSTQETPVSLHRTAHCSSEERGSASEEGGSASEEGGSASEKEDGVSEEEDSASERGVCASKEGEGVPGMGDTPSEERDGGSRMKIANGANPGTSDNPPTQSALPVPSPPSLVPGPPSQVGGRVCLKSVVGYSGGHRHNLVWHPLRGQCAWLTTCVICHLCFLFLPPPRVHGLLLRQCGGAGSLLHIPPGPPDRSQQTCVCCGTAERWQDPCISRCQWGRGADLGCAFLDVQRPAALP